MLGLSVTDRITGFRGIVIGFVHYLSGCNQALVVPPLDKDGKLQPGEWFDVQRLAVDTAIARIELDNGTTPGFDRAPPKR